MREPKLGDVVEVHCAGEFRGIGILVPRLLEESPSNPYKKFVQWLVPGALSYNYNNGNYGIGPEHTVNVIWSPTEALVHD